ncbi:hypothetical protein ACFQJD_13970 [Haloplanus sp. GCM10025708]
MSDRRDADVEFQMGSTGRSARIVEERCWTPPSRRIRPTGIWRRSAA